jgi:toxin ParE1/3/4
MRLVTSEAAERDLADIFSYTLETWGLEQAERYLRSFHDTFAEIISKPRLGRPTEIDGFSYRRARHRNHFIFYRIEGDEVLVDRILHQRMDPSRHL